MQTITPIDNTESLRATCATCGTRARTHDPIHVHCASHNQRTYTLHECPSCELKFWWPLQADPSVYEDEGFEAYVDYHSGKRPFPRWAVPLFSILPPNPGRALDVGCGDGSVLSRLAQAGYEPYGIDLDEKSIEVARTKFGLEHVGVSTLDSYVDTSLKDGTQFDLVTFFEVLEHQDAPNSFLAQVRLLCRPGCLVAGSVPNRNRFLARIDRAMSDGDLPPHHFLWFSRTSLVRSLERAGFTNIEVQLVGALPFLEIISKLSEVIRRRLGNSARQRWLASPFKALSPALASVLWVGMRLSPSHIFFRCTSPGTAT